MIKPKVHAYLIVGYQTIANLRVVGGDRPEQTTKLQADNAIITNAAVPGLPEEILTMQYRKVLYKPESWFSESKIMLKNSKWLLMRDFDNLEQLRVEADLGTTARSEPGPTGSNSEDKVAIEVPENFNYGELRSTLALPEEAIELQTRRNIDSIEGQGKAPQGHQGAPIHGPTVLELVIVNGWQYRYPELVGACIQYESEYVLKKGNLVLHQPECVHKVSGIEGRNTHHSANLLLDDPVKYFEGLRKMEEKVSVCAGLRAIEAWSLFKTPAGASSRDVGIAVSLGFAFSDRLEGATHDNMITIGCTLHSSKLTSTPPNTAIPNNDIHILRLQ